MFDLSASAMWWLVAGALVVAELLTGTFYLLMLALGAATAALAAWAGAGLTTQLAVAALAGGGAVGGWHAWRSRPRDDGSNPSAAADLNLDIGSLVQVDDWRSDGTARVHHRGSIWDARLAAANGAACAGTHRIAARQGNVLLLKPLDAS